MDAERPVDVDAFLRRLAEVLIDVGRDSEQPTNKTTNKRGDS